MPSPGRAGRPDPMDRGGDVVPQHGGGLTQECAHTPVKGRRRRVKPEWGRSPLLLRSAGGVRATVLGAAEGAGPQSERTEHTTV